MAEEPASLTPQFYCAKCAKPAAIPLCCGDCGSMICRECGTPLEDVEEMAHG